ncbi:MAG: Smr/MutS family protein [Gemmatimonadales bacterium]|nr:Smr/MutS family protein [Gemmatimonadales bacterium]
MSATPLSRHGVSSSSEGDTPSTLHPVPSEGALQSIEFDAVLELVADHAAGALGASAIRARRPGTDVSWIRSELADVGEVLAVLRRGDLVVVSPVPDIRTALGRLRLDGAVLELSELVTVRLTLLATRTMLREMDRLAEVCPRLAARRAAPIDRALERALEQSVSEDGELLDSASPALAAARREVHASRERLLRRLEGMLREMDATALPSGATVTMRGGRYVIPVRRDARQRPDGIIHDESGSAGTLFIEPTAAIALGNAMRAAVLDEERETLKVLRELTELLRPARPAIAALHTMAVDVDVISARAAWALASAGEVPVVHDVGGPIALRDARHPLLLAREIRVVPFDLELEPGERTLLISGPNTGGKTVLLKGTALMIALAQAGIVPPVGAGTELPVVHHMFVDIGDHQSLADDLSTFAAHVGELRRILDHADASTLVVLDEIGSGTDPAEGGALAMAVLETLTRRGVLTLATTHLGALKTLASRTPGVVNGSLQFDAATLSPTYRFTKGIPGRSYGIAIARRLGIDPEVVAAAEALVPEAERDLDQLIASVEAREQSLHKLEATLQERTIDIETREAVAVSRESIHDERDAALRTREKEAERERARQAKAYLLEARKRVEAALSLARGAVDEAAGKEARRLVEEGVREESLRADENVVERGGDRSAINVGDRVRMGTGSTGDVVEIRGDGRAVVLVGAMRLVVQAASLTPIAARERRAAAEAPMLGDAAERDAVHELDLRGMRADEAESMVLGAVDAAVLSEQPTLRIIHGMGTGVLRDVVRRLMQSDKRVASFDFAPRQQGGTGVTVVVLR